MMDPTDTGYNTFFLSWSRNFFVKTIPYKYEVRPKIFVFEFHNRMFKLFILGIFDPNTSIKVLRNVVR